VYIKSDSYIEKASKLAEGEVEFIVSSDVVDSHGERINVEGIDLRDFKKNPVILWGHDSFNLPIAKATKVWKEDGKLMARALFNLKDEFASKVYNYILDGFLKACSIGGMVEEWGSDGMTISRMKMKEFSVVSIGANQEALVVGKSLSKDETSELQHMANNYARKLLTAETKDSLVEGVEVLQKMVTTLKELTSNGETHDETVTAITTRRVILRQAQVVDQQVETVIKLVKLKGVL
jgi:HK97 family phage prohead protease